MQNFWWDIWATQSKLVLMIVRCKPGTCGVARVLTNQNPEFPSAPGPLVEVLRCLAYNDQLEAQFTLRAKNIPPDILNDISLLQEHYTLYMVKIMLVSSSFTNLLDVKPNFQFHDRAF